MSEKSEKVIVACKIRNGLNIEGVVVNGYFQAPGEPVPQPSVYGYGLTEFPRDAWERWFDRNKDGDIVRTNHILAGDSVEAVKEMIIRKVGVRQRTFGMSLYTGR